MSLKCDVCCCQCFQQINPETNLLQVVKVTQTFRKHVGTSNISLLHRSHCKTINSIGRGLSVASRSNHDILR